MASAKCGRDVVREGVLSGKLRGERSAAIAQRSPRSNASIKLPGVALIMLTFCRSANFLMR